MKESVHRFNMTKFRLSDYGKLWLIVIKLLSFLYNIQKMYTKYKIIVSFLSSLMYEINFVVGIQCFRTFRKNAICI